MEYNVIKNEITYEESEKRSKFISYSFKVNSEEEIRKKINKIKSEHHSAKHHVYAYKLKSSEKYSDDGEPSGTGGLPILGAIKSFNLVDVLVMVVRYFGGVLLGTNGLRKMYLSGAQNVLNRSQIKKIELCYEILYTCDYKKFKHVLNIIESSHGIIKNIEYSTGINIKFYIKKELFNLIKEKLEKIIYDKKNLKILSESYQEVKN